jgi:iron-sulfur cluster assembly accessory protein
MIEVTAAAAAELGQMLQQRHSPPTHGLRLWVEKGGCAGLSYAMGLGAPEPEDEVVHSPGGAFILAAATAHLLRGIRIDFVDSLSDSGFKIDNPQATRACGCGTSFEPVSA